MKNVGIDAMSFYVPRLYVEMSDLAEARGIPYEKLKFGLGLEQMAVPDLNEDAASFPGTQIFPPVFLPQVESPDISD